MHYRSGMKLRIKGFLNTNIKIQKKVGLFAFIKKVKQMYSKNIYKMSNYVKTDAM